MTENNIVAKKMLEVMKDIQGISKDATNDFHKYKYASAENMITTVRESMIKHGLVIGGCTCDSVQAVDNNIMVTIIQYQITDVETGNKAYFTIPCEGQDKGDKAIYKALTGGMKYFLRTAFMIPMEDDPEKSSVPRNNTKVSQNGTPPKDDEKAKIIKNINSIYADLINGGYKPTDGQKKLMTTLSSGSMASLNTVLNQVKKIASEQSIDYEELMK